MSKTVTCLNCKHSKFMAGVAAILALLGVGIIVKIACKK